MVWLVGCFGCACGSDCCYGVVVVVVVGGGVVAVVQSFPIAVLASIIANIGLRSDTFFFAKWCANSEQSFPGEV